MLIEKKDTVAAGDVIVFRLVTGDEIIAKLTNIDHVGNVTVTKPIVLQMQMVAPNQAGIGFAPFMVGAEEADKYTFPAMHLVVQPLKARKDLAGNYIQATTGLAVAQTPGIIAP